MIPPIGTISRAAHLGTPGAMGHSSRRAVRYGGKLARIDWEASLNACAGGNGRGGVRQSYIVLIVDDPADGYGVSVVGAVDKFRVSWSSTPPLLTKLVGLPAASKIGVPPSVSL